MVTRLGEGGAGIPVVIVGDRGSSPAMRSAAVVTAY